MRFTHTRDLSRYSSLSLNTSINGPWHRIEAANMVSFQVSFSGGTLNGSFQIETANGSETYPGNGPSSAGSVLEGSTYQVINGLVAGDDTLTINIPYACFGWARLTFTNTSGTGSIVDSVISLKGV